MYAKDYWIGFWRLPAPADLIVVEGTHHVIVLVTNFADVTEKAGRTGEVLDWIGYGISGLRNIYPQHKI